MDPMMELFFDECNDILQDMRKCMVSARKEKAYNGDVVQRLFRGVHTLKADSTMMLYDPMAELSRNLEGLLYCFKGEDKVVKDSERFTTIINGYLNYFEEQTDALADGGAPESYEESLMRQIEEYTEELKSEMDEEDRASYQQQVSKKKRQLFYIPGAAVPATPDQKQEEEKNDVEENVDGETEDQSVKKYIITEDEKNKIFNSVRHLQRLFSNIEYTQDDDGLCRVTGKQLEKMKEVCEELEDVKRHLDKTDFVPVAKKLEIVVDEIAEKLHKNVKLTIQGEETPVDYEIREKLSAALIHVVRNAVDHGIEDMEGRELAGKSPMGLILLDFHTMDGYLEICVQDDGRGMNQEAILKKADREGLLRKPKEEYTKSEIIDLVLKSGFTTKEIPEEYSGRGVGMDVIAHNVEELGGTLNIDTKEGVGTKITIRI